MNTLTDLLLDVGQPRVSHFPDLCTLLYTYLSTLDYWTKIVYYLFTQTSPVAHTSALTPTYIKSQKLPNWPISKELGLGRMLLPHWKLLFWMVSSAWWRRRLDHAVLFKSFISVTHCPSQRNWWIVQIYGIPMPEQVGIFFRGFARLMKVSHCPSGSSLVIAMTWRTARARILNVKFPM